MFRHHFRAVQLPETFRKEVLGSTLLQNLVKPLSRVALWVLPDPANVFIDLQNCYSSYSDKTSEPAAVVDPGPRRRILDVETDLVDDILSSVEAEIGDTTGSKLANESENLVEHRFLKRVSKISDVPDSITMAPRGVLDPDTSNLPYANELSEVYRKANFHSRCSIHRGYLMAEALRLKILAESTFQRMQEVQEEIKRHDADAADRKDLELGDNGSTRKRVSPGATGDLGFERPRKMLKTAQRITITSSSESDDQSDVPPRFESARPRVDSARSRVETTHSGVDSARPRVETARSGVDSTRSRDGSSLPASFPPVGGQLNARMRSPIQDISGESLEGLSLLKCSSI